MKKCSTCKIDKPESDFSKYKKSKDGLQYRCKTCVKAWYLKNRDSHRAHVKAYNESLIPEKTCKCGDSFRSKRLICESCIEKSRKVKCPDCMRTMAGRNCSAWEGPSYTHHKGYIMCKVPDRGYVFEHVLTMEQKMGRKLLPNENVHHLNGVRCDNRIENLELWCKPQPVGVRVEDAIAWAEKILATYKSS